MLHQTPALMGGDTPPDGPDSPVAVLKRHPADLLGKQVAPFFPNGTMAKQTVLRRHADGRERPACVAHPQSRLEVCRSRATTPCPANERAAPAM
ncbi:beta-eliminating lyase-related protein [Nonomuraea aridisoli]|uniref:Uncharacterized protein n=1 Tax=Nonomuraea aridisoli TaxID=2070368 RepID=A0A2W2DTP5_9ACTN|nr:beta-eliminating lyase-related protein [Nonomuraea aridisoli]PZG07479.1 hypothetical protein C1J01_40645 [Nonomuraea aridisoli]